MAKSIIICTSNDLSYDQRMQKTAASLSKHGYNVLLLGRSLSSSIPLKKTQCRQRRYRLMFSRGKLFYLELNIRLLLTLLRERPDIILAVDADTLGAASLVSWVLKKPLVYDSHELFTEVPELAGRDLSKRIWSFIERIGVKQSSARYTVGVKLAQELESRYRKPFQYVVNAPKYSDDVTASANDDRYILYQGALNQGRGLEELIQALKGLPYCLKIAGEGDLSQNLRDLVKKLGMQEKVEFLGYLPPEELRWVTLSAYIGYGLLESSSLSYYYSLANKFLDYIMAQVPSLMPALPEYENIQKQFSCTVLCELDIQQIRQSLQSMFESKEYYDRLKRGCLEARERLNWENEEQKLIELFQKL